MIKISLIISTDSGGGVSASVDNESQSPTPTEIELLKRESLNGFKGYTDMVTAISHRVLSLGPKVDQ